MMDPIFDSSIRLKAGPNSIHTHLIHYYYYDYGKIIEED